MSKSTKYLLVSLPTSISPSDNRDDALAALRSAVSTDYGTTYPFNIPSDFKVGTLDTLVQQADDLAKLASSCEGVVGKVADSLRNIFEGDEEKLAQQRTVNDKPVEKYLESFTWNKVKYRADKPVSELVGSLQRELASIDNDVKSKFNQYNQAKTALAAAQRKQTGNLSQRSLVSILDPSLLIQDSEYLETHLIAVPKTQVKDFYRSYESLAPMIVPRSAISAASDDEFTLFAVTTFKKHSAEFIHRCREKRWVPRDFNLKEGDKEEEEKELDKLTKAERKLWGEALRLGRTGYSDSAMIWIHVLALRVFVETVLRYGLPLRYVCGLIKTNGKLAKRAKASLDSAYSYLGGNAFSRDKKGRVSNNDSLSSAEMQAAGHGGDVQDYTAYVYYEFELV